MKIILALAIFVTTNAFAVDLCSFEETWQLDEALETQRVRPVYVADNRQAFTNVEKRLIYTAVVQQGWRAGSSMKKTLEIFEGGEIQYFNIKGQKLALVHYWPGDNEYGAFFSHVNGQYYLVAKIEDGSIICK